MNVQASDSADRRQSDESTDLKAESELKAEQADIANRKAAIAAASAKSPFRPMTDEERAELEAIYQDRGCGVECDPDTPTCDS